MAVGFYLDGSGRDAALAEFWNGTSWKLEKAANPAGAAHTILQAVSCTSAKACTAVSDYDNSANTPLIFAERWNGTTWTVQSTPEPPNRSSPYRICLLREARSRSSARCLAASSSAAADAAAAEERAAADERAAANECAAAADERAAAAAAAALGRSSATAFT
jgi:hypothetical protein